MTTGSELLDQLALEGHSVRSVTDGHSALEALRRSSPKWSLDVGLPDMSGYEVPAECDRTRRRGLMIVTLSGYVSSRTSVNRTRGGATSISGSPSILDLLRGLLTGTFSGRRARGGGPVADPGRRDTGQSYRDRYWPVSAARTVLAYNLTTAHRCSLCPSVSRNFGHFSAIVLSPACVARGSLAAGWDHDRSRIIVP